MPDLGFEVLLKGKNFARLMGGLWVALRISLISVVISIPLGILLGIVMTWKNPISRVLTRIYLEIIRIMPQLVLLFLVFFGLGHQRRTGFHYRVLPVGNCGDGRSGPRRADQHSDSSV